ncbi:hypothetical protein DFR58_1088 [Anaerobacterium chartisolvens]|uniref:Transglycosylase-like protein with SLT domain n=1 Tax=Anaerobacterium chartisolvens TaxID=1297424 RepID=A0A369B717_9FIRM|nr:hypothetical protein [Anaerobacterium chartisolvens]RCX17115.1 hypothetical protein DFR58_1088 [Anaerobacterium chartisolvens]
MRKSKGLLTVVAAVCFILGCLSPHQAYALSNTLTTDKVLVSEKDTKNKSDSQTEEAGLKEGQDTDDPDDHTTGPAVTESAENSGSPDENTSSQNIDTDDNVPKSDDKADLKDDTKNSDKVDENLWYSKKNPMQKDHQKLLWDCCQKRNIDYIDMLALIYTESNFNEKCTTGKYHGYFQISTGNCANLAATLKTKNKPLDGTININWGTAMYGWILADKRVKGLEGKKKRDIALSIYQRGTGGYDKHGISTKFLDIYYEKRSIAVQWYETKNK